MDDYTPRELARLAFSDAAREVAQELVRLSWTRTDDPDHDLALTGRADDVLAAAHVLLRAAVVADRLDGRSWKEIGELMEVSRQTVHARFAAAEREFHDLLLFLPGAVDSRVAPAALYDPELVRKRLDEWVVTNRASTGVHGDEAQPVTRGMHSARDVADWVRQRIRLIERLDEALVRDDYPSGFTRSDAELRRAQLMLGLHRRLLGEAATAEERESRTAEVAKRRSALIACEIAWVRDHLTIVSLTAQRARVELNARSVAMVERSRYHGSRGWWLWGIDVHGEPDPGDGAWPLRLVDDDADADAVATAALAAVARYIASDLAKGIGPFTPDGIAGPLAGAARDMATRQQGSVISVPLHAQPDLGGAGEKPS